MDYRTIAAPVSESFTEKRSEFIGYLTPVTTAQEAIDFIGSVKADHRKARHHVYAYILRDGHTTRYSDDGEPQGTAGVPVLEVLQKRELTDICCVVVRYFGGILLGGGGLVRAYSHSASLACDAAQIRYMCESTPLTLQMDYNLYGKVTNLLPQFHVIEDSCDFGTDVLLSLTVRNEVLGALRSQLTELSAGRIVMETGVPGYA
ncbi:MAG: YigZ family protein, partial [Oscillospiraceae bacterium]|nr:YigZ family protein [Oscillospiraceae bacterium]